MPAGNSQLTLDCGTGPVHLYRIAMHCSLAEVRMELE